MSVYLFLFGIVSVLVTVVCIPSGQFGFLTLLLMVALVSPTQSSFLFSVVWSVGACVDTDSRVKFDAFFRDLINGKNEEHPIPSIVGKIDAPIPAEGLVYDFLFEVRLVCIQYLVSCCT